MKIRKIDRLVLEEIIESISEKYEKITLEEFLGACDSGLVQEEIIVQLKSNRG